ncbi:sugar phosphate nucleotidyltransferase [Chloroflexota bacterium]
MKVIILAGGKGTRLKPFTEALPKPMLPIVSRPLLEIIIDYLKRCGFDEVILALSHLKGNIVNHFEDGRRFGVKITYSEEKFPLGTAGGVKKAASGIKNTFVVALGDGLADIDYRTLLEYHRGLNATGTMVVFEQKLRIPYGVLTLDLDRENSILNIVETPELTLLVNTGITVLEPKSLDYVADGEFLRMPDLFLRLKEAGEKVVAYHHKGNWIDIGQDIEHYLKVNQQIEERNTTFDQTLTQVIFGTDQ